jgi:reactive intermediate/imine deaminase
MRKYLAAAVIAAAIPAAGAQGIHHFSASPEYPFSRAVRAGDMVYLSGQLGADEKGLVKGFEAQAHQTMRNIRNVLKEAGLGMEDIVKCTVYLRDMRDWPKFNAVYKTYFTAGRYPARSALGTNGLALDADLEVDCNAYQPRPALPELALVLKPSDDKVGVELRLGEGAVRGTALLEVPVMAANQKVPAYTEKDIEASDAAGALPLSVAVVDSPLWGKVRKFSATRAPSGPITVRLAAPLPAEGAPRVSGPPFDLRRAAGGFSAVGFGFIPLPAGDAEYDIKLHWDLSELPSGSRAVSSLGVGDVSTRGKSQVLAASYYMAGPLALYPATADSRSLFLAAWQGTPKFDIKQVAAWAVRLREAQKSFFRNVDFKPFRMFARPGSISISGGAAQTDSFMVSYGTTPESEATIKFLIAHEMAHPVLGVLDGGPLETNWYQEGMAEYYKLRVPLKSGLVTAEEYLEELNNRSVKPYYGNPHRAIPFKDVEARFWSDSKVRDVPYQRGLMYFADLNAKIRAATGGKRSLDDVVAAMFLSRQQGQGYSIETWRTLVVKELGPSASIDLDNMLAGQMIAPDSSAFGPCFRRQPADQGYVWVRTTAPASRCGE